MKLHRLVSFGAPLLLAAGAALVAASAGGCTVTTGSPLDGGDFDGSITTPLPPENDSGGTTTPPTGGCNECLFQQCSGSWTVCQNDPECLAIYTCATTTPSCDQNCINNCFCQHPTGQTKYVALAACDSYYACKSCQSQCPTLSTAAACTNPGVIQVDVCGTTPPPNDAGTGVDAAPPEDAGTLVDSATPPPPTDAATVQDCTTCTSTSCSNEKAACGQGTECEAYTLCLAACQDAACFAKCGTDHASGQAASQALENCTLSNCKAACGL